MSGTRARTAGPEAAVTIGRLTLEDERRFATLAAMSGLPSLNQDAHRLRLLQHGVVIAALGRAGDVIGCCCIKPCIVLSYVHLSGRILSLPLPNAYLCGAFVHPAYRGRGIGSMVYAKRLELVEASGVKFIAVEILGEGVPYSLSPGARPGFFFHIRAGFTVNGYSIDKDRGPVLIRQDDRNTSARP
jgi:ribosomal protein S18 acetylase RimI-like enzyme